jgi:predicted ArsR family transcriptional regulator
VIRATDLVRAALGPGLPVPGALDCDDLGTRLGLSARTVRRALRDLREEALRAEQRARWTTRVAS